MWRGIVFIPCAAQNVHIYSLRLICLFVNTCMVCAKSIERFCFFPPCSRIWNERCQPGIGWAELFEQVTPTLRCSHFDKHRRTLTENACSYYPTQSQLLRLIPGRFARPQHGHRANSYAHSCTTPMNCLLPIWLAITVIRITVDLRSFSFYRSIACCINGWIKCATRIVKWIANQARLFWPSITDGWPTRRWWPDVLDEIVQKFLIFF